MERVRNFVGSFYSRQNSDFIKVSKSLGINFFRRAVTGCTLSTSISVLLCRLMHMIFNF